MELGHRFESDGLLVAGVTRSERDGARAFAGETGADYPILYGAEATFEGFRVSAVPRVYLVEPSGRIVADGLSASAEQLERELAD